MKIIILSDIHSNLEALQAVLGIVEQYKDIIIFCLGDIVGYGANPKECIKEVKRVAEVTIAGNHDYAAIEQIVAEFFNPIAKEAIEWTIKHLDEREITYLKGLPLSKEYKGRYYLVHATPYEPDKWHYLFTYGEARVNFASFTTPLCFIGHSHIPFVIESGPDTLISKDIDKTVKLKKGYRYIINSGSVGQPRDRDWRACFVVYDDEEHTIAFKRIEYDIFTAQKKIIEAGLPGQLAERLRHGR